METIRSITVTIEVETNKRTIRKEFHDADNLFAAGDWALLEAERIATEIAEEVG